MAKNIKKGNYYVWYLGWKECNCVAGVESVLRTVHELIERRHYEELPKLTLEVSRKEIKVTQLADNSRSRIEKIKYPAIPSRDVTFAMQCEAPNDDVVACIYLGYNPTTRCAVHIHVYRCDSPSSATMFCHHLLQLVNLPEHLSRTNRIEEELVAKGQVVPRKFSSRVDDRSEDLRYQMLEGDSGYGASSENFQDEDIYNSLTAELKQKLTGREQPLLLPPKDYDTLHRAGKLTEETRRLLNHSIIGPSGAIIKQSRPTDSRSDISSVTHSKWRFDVNHEDSVPQTRSQERGRTADKGANPLRRAISPERGGWVAIGERGRRSPSPSYRERPASPYRERPASPYRERPASPYRERPASPYRERPASPYRERPASPYRARPASPYRERPASPYRERPYGGSTSGSYDGQKVEGDSSPLRGRPRTRNVPIVSDRARALSPPPELRQSYFPSGQELPNYMFEGHQSRQDVTVPENGHKLSAAVYDSVQGPMHYTKRDFEYGQNNTAFISQKPTYTQPRPSYPQHGPAYPEQRPEQSAHNPRPQSNASHATPTHPLQRTGYPPVPPQPLNFAPLNPGYAPTPQRPSYSAQEPYLRAPLGPGYDAAGRRSNGSPRENSGSSGSGKKYSASALGLVRPRFENDRGYDQRLNFSPQQRYH